MAFRIQIRRDTASRWAVNNPVLLQGEMGYETDTDLLKIGDGTTTWNDLDYWNGNLTIETDGTEVIQGAGTINFTGGVLGSATGGVVTLDFSNVNGVTGPAGPTADIGVFDNTTFVAGITGIQFSGGGVSVSGSGSLATVNIGSLQNSVYSTTVRYLIDNTTAQAAGGPSIGSNDKITLMSSGNIYFNRTWTRSATTLTINSTAHGLSVGDGVLVRNSTASDSYNYYIVQTSVPNSFTVTVANSGTTSGSELAYIPAFSVSTWTSGTAITVSSPTVGNAQLLSLTVNTTLNATSFAVTVDGQGISNGGGSNTSAQTMNPPVVSAHNRTSGADLDASCTLDTSSPFQTFNIIGMNNVGTGDQTIMKFNF
jgi:hypothetical protein